MRKVKSAHMGKVRISPPPGFYLEQVGDAWYTRNNEECLSVAGIFTNKRFVVTDAPFKKLVNASTFGTAEGTACYGTICAEHTVFDFPVAISAFAMLHVSGMQSPGTISVNAPVCENAEYMLSRISKLVAVNDLYLPVAKKVACLLLSSTISEFNHQLPSATDIRSIFFQSQYIGRVSTDFSKAVLGEDAFAQTPLLKYVHTDFSSLLSAPGIFRDSGLEVDTINAILESLPEYSSGVHIITFTGCPGAEKCSPEIATRKGWTVQI